MSTNSSPFDPVAEMYWRLWNDWYLSSARAALDRVFFSHVVPGSSVLDVCCGCGHITKELLQRGYRVTGVDISQGLIDVARREMPDADWQVQDVRFLQLPSTYDAALSTFDSFNQLSSVEDLALVFQGVRRALRLDGRFTFDMNLEEAYRKGTKQWVVEVANTEVSLMRGSYNAKTNQAATELLWFVRDEATGFWRHQRSTIHQRSFTEEEIIGTLVSSGFRGIETLPGEEAGLTDGLGIGRLFVSALAA